MARTYRRHLRTAVGSSAAPYGYTLATWTTGAVLSHAYGIPTAVDACCSCRGCGRPLRALAAGQAAIWGSFHFLSVGPAGWLLAPFASAIAYLLVLDAQFSAADERAPGERDR